MARALARQAQTPGLLQAAFSVSWIAFGPGVWPLIEKGTAASVWELWRETIERGQLRVVS
jgi:hypothetical protein